MTNPNAAMLVIGDEILSGRTRDSNMHHLAGALTEHGIALVEARMIPDDHEGIVRHVRQLAGAYDHLFTSGGIGPTHDDITAEAVAEAMGVACSVRDDARAILQRHYDRSGQELNEARLRMARIPDTATLIDNPISAAPGFTLGNVHVMAGVPTIFEAMLAGILPTLTGGAPMVSDSLRVEQGEGDIAGPLGNLADRYPEVSIGSYPFTQNGLHGSNVVVRSQDPAAVARVMAVLRDLFPAAP
ncbi:molybdopterin-binding protein [Hasllibacter sp. MH4015]|uniref:competence/damage-inducible protein A n=1 Tax=Hasllibacter sp. MH4015 TaxID=2854029 RepID=UPI001CD4D57B|nr:molybdopterin-binding protein [Hasllibacter sp. MH4015]